MKFEWRGQGQQIEYYINWDVKEEPYQVLYLHYKNVSKIKKIEKGKLVIRDEKEEKYIPIYSSYQCAYKHLPAMPPATYRFELYDNVDKNGEALASIELYVGTKVELYREEIAREDGFADLKLSCQFHLPSEQYGLTVKAMQEEVFWLPEMVMHNGHYETSCMIRKGASKHIDVFLGTKIRDFIEIVDEVRR